MCNKLLKKARKSAPSQEFDQALAAGDQPLSQPHHQPLLPDTELTIYCLKGRIEGRHVSHDGYLGTWEDGGYSFLFFRRAADSHIRSMLEAEAGIELEERFTMTYRDWQGEAAGPMKIGRFLLSPPWLKKVAAADEIPLIFDPGLVFGNGTHPTTLACLVAMEIACAGGRIGRMLDLGTGTGLLALAGARLGCSRVVAVDNNMLAAATAARNSAANGLQERILVVNGLAADFAALPSDLLVANIGYEVLLDVLHCIDPERHRWLVLSGLQDSEAQSIRARLAEMEVVPLKHWRSDSIWNTLLAITRAGR